MNPAIHYTITVWHHRFFFQKAISPALDELESSWKIKFLYSWYDSFTSNCTKFFAIIIPIFAPWPHSNYSGDINSPTDNSPIVPINCLSDCYFIAVSKRRLSHVYTNYSLHASFKYVTRDTLAPILTSFHDNYREMQVTRFPTCTFTETFCPILPTSTVSTTHASKNINK